MNQGTEIKSRRLSRGWTQFELADRCGVTLRTIQRLEKGEVKPSLFTKTKLKEVLEMEFQEDWKDSGFTSKESFTSKSAKLMQTAIQFLNPKSLFLAGLSILAIGSLFWKEQSSFSSDLGVPISISGGLEIQTVNCGTESECDIQVTRKNKNGEILWQKIYGGSSYDKASEVIATFDGGFLIMGSTSSYGQGNYDILLIKTDANGEVQWQKTYGGFFNEYGKTISYGENGNFLQIEGSQQTCSSPNVSENCEMREWSFRIDLDGIELG